MKIFLTILFATFLSAGVFAQDKPTLLSPKVMETMDNGCIDRSNGIVWDFTWQAVAGAKKYQIWVKSDGAQIPAIDKDGIKETIYQYRAPKTFIGGARPTYWTWRVRARVGSKWTEWSAEQKFQVERLNTDCSIKVPIKNDH